MSKKIHGTLVTLPTEPGEYTLTVIGGDLSKCADEQISRFVQEMNYVGSGRTFFLVLESDDKDLRVEVRRVVGVDPSVWSYCPYCGVEVPRLGRHKPECPGDKMQRKEKP